MVLLDEDSGNGIMSEADDRRAFVSIIISRKRSSVRDGRSAPRTERSSMLSFETPLTVRSGVLELLLRVDAESSSRLVSGCGIVAGTGVDEACVVDT